MSKKNKEIRNRNEEIRILKKDLSELKTENNNLVLTNENLESKVNELTQQIKNHSDAENNKLTPKENFVISIPILIVLLVLSITITYFSYKNDTNTLGYKLAIISFIISIISSIYDITKTLLKICVHKNIALLGLSINLESSAVPFLAVIFLAIIFSVLYFYMTPNIDASSSNLLCSITLIIYFFNILINNLLLCVAFRHQNKTF